MSAKNGKSNGKLPPKQAAFIDEYLIDLNATQAAIRAGYSEKTARSQGQRLLTKVDIATAIERGMDARSERTNITADRVLEELARIGLADIRDLMEWDENSVSFTPSGELLAEQAAQVSAVKAKRTCHTDRHGGITEHIELELKTHDKLAALREIGKHVGITDKVEISGTLEVDIDEIRERFARRIAGVASRIGTTAGDPGTNGRGARGA